MAEKIKVPTLGESVTEATVSKWLKSQGEKVLIDEPIVELETDKVNVEVPSPTNGVISNIAVKEGETVNVGALLGTVENATRNKENNIKSEVNEYSPPKKEKREPQPKIFDEEKISKPKNIKPKKIEEPILKLEEEPLILDQAHEEKAVQKKRKANFSCGKKNGKRVKN